MSNFFLSFDFELYWGVSNSKSFKDYKTNIAGVWDAIPEILLILEKYNIKGTWAVVGMIMCENYDQWKNIRPKKFPSYKNLKSSYELDKLVKNNPNYFFALPLIKKILSSQDQEIASHTYSHLCCKETGVTKEQFIHDLECMSMIATKNNIKLKSIVMPRNQYSDEYLSCLEEYGIVVYRGNPQNILYKSGHKPLGGYLTRAIRFLDHYLPLTSIHHNKNNLSKTPKNCPATIFLRPYSQKLKNFEFLKINRIKSLMKRAAKNNFDFHLWFHPHNFGTDLKENLKNLEEIFDYYIYLNKKYGMQSKRMKDLIK